MRIEANESNITVSERQFLLYKYFLANSNEDTVIPYKQLMNFLWQTYGIIISTNTLYNDIAILTHPESFNLDIEYDFSKRGYKLKSHPFEPLELRLLIDSVQAAKFITQKKADELTAKVSTLTDIHTAKKLRRKSFIENRITAMDESVVNNCDRLFEAIDKGKKISFKFFHYRRDGKKDYTKDGKLYIVSPYAMIWRNGFYYLYAYVDGENRFRYFRTDRMDTIKVLLQDREGQEKFAVKNITRSKVKVFGIREGKEETVKLLFNLGLVDAVRDEFGSNLLMMPHDEKRFSITADVRLNMDFYAWLFSFGRGVEIIRPDYVRDKMREYAQNIAEMYKDDGEM